MYAVILSSLFGAMIIEVVYGFEDEDRINHYVDLNDRALAAVVEGFTHGRFWVDYLPWLRYVPSWLPGAEFKRKAEKWREEAVKLREGPFEEARRALVRNFICGDKNMTVDLMCAHQGNGKAGVSNASVVAKMIEGLSVVDSAHDEEVAKNVAGVAFAGTYSHSPTHTQVSVRYLRSQLVQTRYVKKYRLKCAISMRIML